MCLIYVNVMYITQMYMCVCDYVFDICQCYVYITNVYGLL
jgi:hypothetical protein